MEGIIIFNKPKTLTSNDVVEYFKKLTKKKVGHGGTLDPMAQGLLILGVGKYTKELSKFLKESRKTYLAKITLGYKSDTYDAQGKIEKTGFELPKKEVVEKELKNFIGEIWQKPPLYSAIKIKGKPAYKYIREGKKIETQPRKVKIYDLKMVSYLKGDIEILVEVSSGAYIRSLANDLGENLGCGGYLKELVRTKINEFEIDKALTFGDLKKDYLELYSKIFGKVQGVGFRYFIQYWAEKLNLTGYAKNLFDGTVEVLAQGKEKNLQELIEKLKIGPRLAEVRKMDLIFQKPKEYFLGFKIY